LQAEPDLHCENVAQGYFTFTYGTVEGATGNAVKAINSAGICAIACPLKLGKISTSENANGLLRQYFSKGSDFSKLTVLRDTHQIAWWKSSVKIRRPITL
jgi:hypothetical protein